MECLQMLHLSADLAYIHVKTLPWRTYQRSVCKCCTCQRIWRTLTWNTVLAKSQVSANPAPVSGFGAHLRETLPWHKYHGSVCTCRTCQRIWRAPTWNTVLAQVPTECLQMLPIWRKPTWNTVLAQVPTECLQMLHLSTGFWWILGPYVQTTSEAVVRHHVASQKNIEVGSTSSRCNDWL